MKMKFFADSYNGRLVWSWKDGEYETDNAEEIARLQGLGLRCEYQDEEAKQDTIKKYVKEENKKPVGKSRKNKKKAS